MKVKILVIATIFLGISNLVAANGNTVYKWVDENGKVHYTDKKSPNTETTTVNIRKTKPTGSSTSSSDTEKDNDNGNYFEDNPPQPKPLP